MIGSHCFKNSLANIVSSGDVCTATSTKIELADALNSQNQLEKAYGIYKEILGENPGHADALFGMGVMLEKQQKFDVAIQFLCKAIESNPGKTRALLRRGRIFRLQGRYENAIADFSEIISNHQDNFEAMIARGITFGQIGQFNAAINDFSLATQVNPNCSEAFYNRGVVYEKMQQHKFAIEDYSVAIELNPHDYKAYNNRGVARRETKCFDAAIKDFDKSVEVNPDFAEGYYNKSLTLLSIGNLQEGFELYEHRWKTEHFQKQVRHFQQPLWLGNEDLTGKTILLHSEQGLGDSIQFSRYIKSFKNIKCRVLLEIEKPLMTIMQCLLPQTHIFEKNTQLPNFDYHCPLMSLAHVFGTTGNQKTSSASYLKPEFCRAQYWKKRLNRTDRPLVGIAWRGNPNHPRDKARSMRLEDINKHLSKEIEWISLQKSPVDNEIKLLEDNRNIKHFPESLIDFAETAAICEALDAVISVDTSVAHLSASCGNATYIMLCKNADWRWLEKSDTTFWYKAAHLIRNDDEHSWQTALLEAQNKILLGWS